MTREAVQQSVKAFGLMCLALAKRGIALRGETTCLFGFSCLSEREQRVDKQPIDYRQSVLRRYIRAHASLPS
jgi:hypothetical protein